MSEVSFARLQQYAAACVVTLYMQVADDSNNTQPDEDFDNGQSHRQLMNSTNVGYAKVKLCLFKARKQDS